MTLFGRLKFVGENQSSALVRHFILEDATSARYPNQFPNRFEVSLTQSPYQSEAMLNFLGKRLMIAGSVRLNQRRGEPEVVPELMMEVNA